MPSSMIPPTAHDSPGYWLQLCLWNIWSPCALTCHTVTYSPMKRTLVLTSALAFTLAISDSGFAQQPPKPAEGDFVARNFRFRSGEVLPEMNLHYATYGHPIRDGSGRVTNAVMILHGTTGSGQQFTSASFAGVLFGPGQLLDRNRYFIILPDSIGHGRSSKPSDGQHMRF